MASLLSLIHIYPEALVEKARLLIKGEDLEPDPKLALDILTDLEENQTCLLYTSSNGKDKHSFCGERHSSEKYDRRLEVKDSGGVVAQVWV